MRIFKGPRDNYDETSWEYLDPSGAIRAEIKSESAMAVVVEYPEDRFQANQKAIEERALARVARAAPVGDAKVHQNIVDRGRSAALIEHLRAAQEDAANNERISGRDR